MANLIDYIKWRGDITFDISPFNEIDNVIFTQLSSIDFTDVVSSDTSDPVPLHVAVRTVTDRGRAKKTKLGLIVPDIIFTMAALMAESPRYQDILLCSHVCEIDREKEYQFSATTFILSNDAACIVFRGTDDTLVGWKEDFNLAFNPQIPSHNKAVDYLTATASSLGRRIFVCGHSKGGHLSIYSATKADPKIQDRIIKVYCNDGPGFDFNFFSTEEYLRIKPKVTTIVPQGSFVGRIFHQDEDSYRVVKSDVNGLFQHDCFSWQLMKNSFTGDSFTRECERNQMTFNNWISGMSNDDKKMFVDKFFDFLGSAGATTLIELTKNPPQLIKAYKELTDTDKELMKKALRLFLVTSKKTLTDSIAKKPLKLPIKIKITSDDNSSEENAKQ